MLTQFSRTELLFGKEAMDKLAHSRVAVFGIGGVGGFACEALVRSGVGAYVDVLVHKCFFLPENADDFPFEEYDYIIDAVDTVTAKIAIVMKAQALGIPVISSMGAGNKLDPTAFRVADIYKTKVCPLAKVMRR